MYIPVKNIKIISMPKKPEMPFRSGDRVKAGRGLGNGIVVGFDKNTSEPYVFFYSQQDTVSASNMKISRGQIEPYGYIGNIYSSDAHGVIVPTPKKPEMPFRSGDRVEGPEKLGEGIVVGFDEKVSEPYVFFYSQQITVMIYYKELRRLPFINVGGFFCD